MAKKKKNIVYSTNPDFSYDYEEDVEETTLPPQQQNLRVMIDRKNRKGKAVVLVDGFVGTADDLDELGRWLKSKCGVGGNVKDGQIIIQGDNRKKVADLLEQEGYRFKLVGG